MTGVNIALDLETLEWLRERSAALKVPLSQYVRGVIREHRERGEGHALESIKESEADKGGYRRSLEARLAVLEEQMLDVLGMLREEA